MEKKLDSHKIEGIKCFQFMSKSYSCDDVWHWVTCDE